MFEFHYTPHQDTRKALEDLRKKIDFKPNLAIFFLAGNLCKSPEKFKLDCNSISIPVEGIITPKAVWSRGALLLITESDVKIKVFNENAEDVCKKIVRMEKGDFNLLIYPVMFIKSRLTGLRVLRKLKTSEPEKASKAYKEIIYPMDTILKPFRDEEKAAVAMNLFPLTLGIGYPKISFNGKKLGRGVLSISFKEKVDCIFGDTFPERGKSFEETAEILSQELVSAKKVSIVKKGIAIGEIDGMKVKEFLRKQRIVMRENLEKDIVNAKFVGATPYVLSLISKETYGSSILGLMDYDLNFYPSLFETDLFYDEAIFGGEFIKGGIERVSEESQESEFAILDQNFMLMFEERIVEIVDVIKGHGVFTSFPSYTGKLRKNFMSEIERNLCVNGTGTMVFLNFK